MRIYRFWARATQTATDDKGREQTFNACGWSNDSIEHARARARERVQRVCDLVARGESLGRGEYDYLDVPLREEVIDRVANGDDELAIVTRNRYGALVLNAERVCFVDIDFAPVRSRGLWDGLMLAFSGKRRRERRRAVRDRAVWDVKNWAERNPARSFRLYRTFAGMRLLFTDRLYAADSGEVRALLEELGSDPLYCRLTEKQACFRARLTPKPWRCGSERPPGTHPRDTEPVRQAFEEWLVDYKARIEGHVACRFVQAFGKPAAEEAISAIVDWHDHYACGEPGARLA